MDRAVLKDHLAQAERHVIEGERHLACQRCLLHELERKGRDTTAARLLLGSFEQMQALHRANRDRVLAELEETE
jgi:hypothetical protein